MENNILEKNPDLIKKIQLKQLEILKDFDKFCREHKLNYQIHSGTLLGAIRHKGFIPWDDDVDVAMMRDDYERFISLGDKFGGSKYFVQNLKTDDKTQVMFTKIRENNTIYKEKHVAHLNTHHGIFIDLFPLDNVKHYNYKGLNLRIASILYRVYLISKRSLDSFAGNKKFIKRTLDFIITDSFSNKIKLRVDKLIRKYEKVETTYVNHLTNGIFEDKYPRFLMEKDDFTNIIDVSFEGHFVMAPKNFDKYLKRMYGDYMKLPPKEEQKPHHNIVEVKF